MVSKPLVSPPGLLCTNLMCALLQGWSPPSDAPTTHQAVWGANEARAGATRHLRHRSFIVASGTSLRAASGAALPHSLTLHTCLHISTCPGLFSKVLLK